MKVAINLKIHFIFSKTSYLKKENISKESNIPLSSHTYHIVDENDDVVCIIIICY